MSLTESSYGHQQPDLRRLITQIRRLEARSGGRAASISLLVPAHVDVGALVGALVEELQVDVTTHRNDTVPVCQIVSVDFDMPAARHAGGAS